MRSRLARIGLAFAGIIGFVALGIALEAKTGIPFAITYRLACAGSCLWIIVRFAADYPGERWPWAGVALALLLDVALFFTPFADLPASKGDVLIFALPDAIIMLGARIATYRVTDVHRRAVRQQMIMALILAIAFCAVFSALILMAPRSPAG